MQSRINVQRVPLGDMLTAKIVERAALASPDEKAQVADLIQKAIDQANHPTQVEVMMTSRMAAILFLDHNKYNRGWDPNWSQDLSRMMEAQSWRQGPQGYALYGDKGDVADGSHRLAAQAVSDTDLSVFVYLGMNKNDVAALDNGKRRTAADAAALAGVTNAKAKAELLNAIWAYEKAAGFTNPVHTANIQAVAQQITDNSGMLARVLEIGETSLVDAIDPMVAEKTAARIAALLVRHGWPEPRAIERLEEIQTSDFDHDKAPLAVARKIIEDLRPKSDTIRPQAEIGVIIKGMLLAESGQDTVNPRRISEIKNAAKNLPDPTYPGPAALGHTAAAAD